MPGKSEAEVSQAKASQAEASQPDVSQAEAGPKPSRSQAKAPLNIHCLENLAKSLLQMLC